MFTNCKQTHKSYQSSIKNLLLRIDPNTRTRSFTSGFIFKIGSTGCAEVLRREASFCSDIKVVPLLNLDWYIYLN